MNKVYKYELERFGLRELFYHVLFSITLSEKYRYKMLKLKDKYYDQLTSDQMAEEVINQYVSVTGDKFDISKPETFNQWIQWIKIYDNNERKAMMSDKYMVRKFVKKTIGEDHLVPLLGVWNHFNEIDFDALPNSFCLKLNHGCAMNYIVKEKEKMDLQEAKRLFTYWEDLPFYCFSLELQYKNIKRKVLAEKYIEEMDGNLYDYKIHCFNGEPQIIQVIGDRDLVHHKGKEAFFDTSWKRNNLMYNTYAQYEKDPKKPKSLEVMIEIARKLSANFNYVRVDLYDVNGKIYFGEMTFTPASGFGYWKNESSNLEVGKKIKKAVEIRNNSKGNEIG